MKYLFHLTVEEFEKLISEIIDKKLNQFNDEAANRNAPDELLSRKEAAKLLKISTVTLDRYKREGVIEEATRFGKPVKFFKSHLMNALGKKKNGRNIK